MPVGRPVQQRLDQPRRHRRLFLAAYDFLTNPANYSLDKAPKSQLKHKTFHGNEIVANTRRRC
jgi:hypothetical protein